MQDKTQLAINKYEKRFQKFMAKMNKDINNDKIFYNSRKRWQ